jgi:hypothetical protein
VADRTEPIAKSVRNLENLYAVVVAVALTLAVQQLVIEGGRSPAFRWSVLWALVGFVVTLVPFYHGSERHLEATFVEAETTELRPLRLLWDFVVLFVEACVLLAIGALVAHPSSMLVALIVLFLIDIVWGLVAKFFLRSGENVWTWAMINSVAAFVFGLLYVLDHTVGISDLLLSVLIMVTSVARSTADYAFGWTFYFPPKRV